MSKSAEKTQVLTENNERSLLRKRRLSSSPDSAEEFSPKHSKAPKRWKGGISTELQPDLMEELGVSILSETSEEVIQTSRNSEDKAIENFLSSEEENENIDSTLTNRKAGLKKKKKKKGFAISQKGIEIQPLIGCLNNNSLPVGKVKESEMDSTADAASNEKENMKTNLSRDESSIVPIEKSGLEECCLVGGSGSGAAKENPKNLKWEKLKPVNCKIRNSKIFYQNEFTSIESDGKSAKSNEERDGKNKGEWSLITDEDDDGFIIRRKSRVEAEDHFSQLSDEVILSIFKWLPKRTLFNCTLVCKRFLRLACDEVLWTRLDLGGRNLPVNAVGSIVARGSRILRLAQAALPDPVYCPSLTPLPADFASKLQYVDLSMATISPVGLATFLNFCRSLKKLSLENCHLNYECAVAIGRNSQLEVLNLTMCIGLTVSEIDEILSNCKRLQALNISWAGLSLSSLDVIASKVPSTLERLNISGCRKYLTDEHVIEIFHRCENLIELDVSDSIELTDQVVHFIVEFVQKIEYLSFSRCYSINTSSFPLLKHVDSLMYLDVFGLLKENELIELKKALVDVSINQFTFSSVARPTVGIRRTSIWGLRVRD